MEATQNTTETAAPITPEVRLESAKSKKIELWGKLRKIEDPESKEYVDLNLEIFKTQAEIKAAEGEISKIEKDKQLAILRNERVALRKSFEDAIRAEIEHFNAVFSKSKKTKEDNEKMNAFTDATKAAREVVDNELLAKFAGSKPSTKATGTATTSTGGSKQAEIKALLLGYIADGKTPTEAVKLTIEEHGHSRGTTGAVRTQMVKDGEIVG